MEQPVKPAEPERGRHYMEEADIGSGEKTPGEQDTEADIRRLPPLPDEHAKPASAGVSAPAPR